MATKKTAKKAPAHRSRKQVAESFADMSKEALSHAKAQLGRPSWPKQECAQQKISAGLADGFDNYKARGMNAPLQAESPVDKAIAAIGYKLDRLEDVMNAHRNQLAGVLSPEIPQPTAGAQAEPEISPLVTRLQSISRNLDYLIDRQVAINNRIVL